MPAHDASAPPAGTSRAFVKCILSGDSLVLKESATSPPASERTVSLAYLVSPRLASSKRGQANDEPYAYDARETMRRVLVGKDIALRVDYSNPTTGREFCSVYAMSPKTREWVNVALLSLQRGCVKLRDEPPRSALPIDYALLQEAQRRAQEARTGLWSDKSPPAITLIQTTDPAAFVKQYKGQTLTGIVEHVRDGGCVKIRVLLDNGHTHHFLWTTFSGIKAPMLKPQGSDAPEPYAEAARDFVEARLLQREVQLLAEDVVPGPNTSNGVLATVLHPFLPFLQRAGAKRVHAVAEHVVNGSRLRVVIPRESAKLAVVLAGIRVPRQGEPGAEEAMALTSSLAMQRDVQIEVDAVDKTGAFIATVHVPDAQGKMKNLAVALLEAGWASIHEYSADQSAYGNQLYAAERSAKAEKAGLWAFEEDEDEEGAEAAAKEAAKKLEQMSVAEAAPTVTKNLAPVTVSEIVTAAHFYLQSMAPDAVANLENMMAQFATYHASPAATATAAPSPLKAGDHVSAKFTADNQWYRARVRKVLNNGTATVVYYDYGNVETVPTATHIRALPAHFTKLPPQAQEARLAYVRAPTATGAFADDAADALDRLRMNGPGKSIVLAL
ncbi:hypothetical protein AMAG_12757 [Allomyces macrogynus ATCC 38327]|uniref:Tudor domain-containing protein n=1 Tax=Allomyces macrogynus (strain ATCC 38327) TaxID=578462 RepID=A0A0L0T1F9_ALLM3|nr:hypothetical protein AMAG_12757 [Allomyces macrogynus ATCC 38327]|eukprot:KNE68591.1 hypothetical protein AMAG_12757 [Allomyces macrogynus ATCC 38327]